MLERIRKILQRRRALQEVGALTDRNLHDLGLTRDQIEIFALMPRDSAARMAAMARLFGISLTALKQDHALYQQMLCVCGTCGDRAACALVLERGDLARPSDCAFCTNAERFAALAPA